MTVLGIDSSDEIISVGIAKDDGVIFSQSIEAARKNILHPFMMDTLEKNGFSIDDLDGVAVSIGPGSFTGLRVGLAAAKGICWASNLPLTGVSSLEAAAACIDGDCPEFVAVKDARRGEFYFASFSMSDGKLERLTPDAVGSVDDVLSSGDNVAFTGPGMPQLKECLDGVLRLREYAFRPDLLGGMVAFRGLSRISAGQLLDIAESSPSYVRIPDYVRKGA